MARKRKQVAGGNEEAEMVRFSVIMAKDLLDRLDRVAGHWKRSQFIAQAVEIRLMRQAPPRKRAVEEVEKASPLARSRRLNGGGAREGFLSVHT